MVQMNTHSIT